MPAKFLILNGRHFGFSAASPPPRLRRRRCTTSRFGGFTLVEVLVSLGILTVALVVALQIAAAHAERARLVRDKTEAHWLASNKIIELQLRDPAQASELSGTELFGSGAWYWTATLSKADTKTPLRVDVQVRQARDDAVPLITMTAYIEG